MSRMYKRDFRAQHIPRPQHQELWLSRNVVLGILLKAVTLLPTPHLPVFFWYLFTGKPKPSAKTLHKGF